MNLSEALGVVVRERRLAMRLSQSDLAIATGLHKNFISLVERGKTAAAIDSVEVIATALKCRASQLLAAAERTRSAADE
ncbi:helix-turn-helix transcriptional regulator [Mitsuaria sp. WAJ17]|uniref:helix-turn-helix domain-containing protein n=1 Tax=Mitsuaria sp. WAJ17 TaxID=2761452 RepID=UPI0016033847|nr:helix-turn-helix transcriptional regulator [Mitsuaria sp. WAJ17]MBB2486831.1 helix-turn-helix transcriptional regulator [Mitsuaria sp. WAJ17]